MPGVIYGHKQETVSVSLSRDDLLGAIRHGARVVDLQPEGGAAEKAQIIEVQWDHLGRTCCTSISAASPRTSAST